MSIIHRNTMKRGSVLSLVALLSCTLVHLTSAKCVNVNDELSAHPISIDLAGTTDFGLTLFKELFLNKGGKNFFFSPYSVWSALALAYLGSHGNTELELRNALGVSDQLHTLKKWRSLEYTYEMRQKNNPGYILKNVNRVYFDKTVPLNNCVEEILTNEVRVVDMTQSTKVSYEINDWVSNSTNGRITNLVNPGDIANAKMVLTNAAYFHGTWRYQFSKNSTRRQVFFSTPSDPALIDMMNLEGYFRYGKSELLGVQILDLPYNGEDISMILLLPSFSFEGDGLESLVNKLDSTTLRGAINGLQKVKVEVGLPKFTFEESVGEELKAALIKMGVRDLFEPLTADLSGFSMKYLNVNNAVHKAFVKVSEEGTEAAAATAFYFFRTLRTGGPPRFVCDRPFLFIIYDHLTNNVLFMGAYKSPNK